VPNIRAPNYIKKTLMHLTAKTDLNTVIVRWLNTSLSFIERSSRQNINKETSEFIDTLDQMNLIDIYRESHLTNMQYTFFSATHGTFSKIDILGHKASINKLKKIEITCQYHIRSQ
jgi:exonuclease III